MLYTSERTFTHDEIPAVGVLLANLGTPERPDAPALRRYLRQFLSDPRVIELPRAQWLPILNLFVLTTRPAKSAALYRQVWTEEGSPLLAITRRQAAGVAAILEREVGTPVHVEAAMTYGEPSIAQALRSLRERGCRRIFVLPLYPQYSGTTTGSVMDAVFRELTTWRWVPELRTVNGYHDRAGYARALAASIREAWDAGGEPERLLFSFHGIPLRYFENGDPYHCFCHETARRTAEELGLARERYIVAFQSLFGREEWLKPYTDVTVRALGQAGTESLDVVCPGFAADCLETLEEIDVQNREFFAEAGGGRFRYLPALNDRPDHLRFLADLVQTELAGWIEPAGEYDAAAAEERAAESRRRAEALAAAGAPADAGVGEG